MAHFRKKTQARGEVVNLTKVLVRTYDSTGGIVELVPTDTYVETYQENTYYLIDQESYDIIRRERRGDRDLAYISNSGIGRGGVRVVELRRYSDNVRLYPMGNG